MKANHIVLLLQTIKDDGSANPLSTRGLEYSQIAELLSSARELGYVALTADGLALTDEGRAFLIASEPIKPEIKEVSSLEKYRIGPIGKQEIYLPERPPRL